MGCKIKKEWLKMESEHTKDISEQRKIVKDHLKEFGCDYYPELKKLERRIKR